MKRNQIPLFILTLLVLCSLAPGARAQTLNRYIVVLNPGSGPPSDVAAEVAQNFRGRVGFVYEKAIQGFSIALPPQALRGLQNDPRIAYVESDDPVRVFAQDVPTGIRRVFADSNEGLDIDGTDDFRVDVDVAVIDTGIDFEHPDLNVVGGINCTYLEGGGPPWSRTVVCKEGEGDDDNFHGTHVAGTIGALDNGIGVVGIAPGARLWAVKVLDNSGSGWESNILAGIDWVVQNADTIEVANMSLGGTGYSQAEYDAIQAAVERGVAFVVSAGNDASDAAGYTPAAFDNVLAVSALADFDGLPGSLGAPTCTSDVDDTLADFSNWGTAVGIAAPGICIFSTFPIEKGEYGTLSGTSMASPHVAGAAAILASRNNPQNAFDVFNLYQALIENGNDGWEDDSGDGIQEPLLDLSNSSVFDPVLVPTGGGENVPPTASFGYSCSNLQCSFNASGSSDVDGTIISWAWDFGDSTSGSGVEPIHTFPSAGTFRVTLTVTDNEGASDSASQDVSVSNGTGEILLTATISKLRGRIQADLAWSGATSSDVDIYRDAILLVTTANDGAYTDELGKVKGGSHTYKVCEAGTAICSNEAVVTF